MKKESFNGESLIRRKAGNTNQILQISALTKHVSSWFEWLLSITRGQGDVE